MLLSHGPRDLVFQGASLLPEPSSSGQRGPARGPVRAPARAWSSGLRGPARGPARAPARASSSGRRGPARGPFACSCPSLVFWSERHRSRMEPAPQEGPRTRNAWGSRGGGRDLGQKRHHTRREFEWGSPDEGGAATLGLTLALAPHKEKKAVRPAIFVFKYFSSGAGALHSKCSRGP